MTSPPVHSRRASGARWLAAPLVAVAVLTGIWVTGGLITDDFRLSMALTFAWMVAAAAICALIAWRSPALRVPVLGAYLVTAALAGAYLGRSTLFEDRVGERVATAPETAPAEQAPDARRPQRPANRLLSRGGFQSLAHPARGRATAIRLPSGRRVLTLSPFEVDNGPDLRVYLVAGPARDESEVDDFKDLGGLKGNKGDQQYELDRDIDLDRYRTVVIWCRAFSVNFARAPLR